MDYTIYRCTVDVVVPNYGGKPQLTGMDHLEVTGDAMWIGFDEKRLGLFEVVEDVKLNIDE